MKLGFYASAMYVELEGEEIDKRPIDLGDKTLHPGQYIQKLGDKKRSLFEMQEGWYLRYVGKVEGYLLFDTNCNSSSDKNIFYAFAYVDKNMLLICDGNRGCRDIRIEKLEVFEDVRMQQINEQLSLFKT